MEKNQESFHIFDHFHTHTMVALSMASWSTYTARRNTNGHIYTWCPAPQLTICVKTVQKRRNMEIVCIGNSFKLRITDSSRRKKAGKHWVDMVGIKISVENK